MVLAKEKESHYPGVYRSASAVLFLGTPHSGTKDAELITIVLKITMAAFRRPATQLLEALRLDSDGLARLNKQFKEACSGLDIVSFYERQAENSALSSSLVRRFPLHALQTKNLVLIACIGCLLEIGPSWN